MAKKVEKAVESVKDSGKKVKAPLAGAKPVADPTLDVLNSLFGAAIEVVKDQDEQASERQRLRDEAKTQINDLVSNILSPTAKINGISVKWETFRKSLIAKLEAITSDDGTEKAVKVALSQPIKDAVMAFAVDQRSAKARVATVLYRYFVQGVALPVPDAVLMECVYRTLATQIQAATRSNIEVWLVAKEVSRAAANELYDQAKAAITARPSVVSKQVSREDLKAARKVAESIDASDAARLRDALLGAGVDQSLVDIDPGKPAKVKPAPATPTAKPAPAVDQTKSLTKLLLGEWADLCFGKGTVEAAKGTDFSVYTYARNNGAGLVGEHCNDEDFKSFASNFSMLASAIATLELDGKVSPKLLLNCQNAVEKIRSKYGV
jgi:hypothetical protein